MDVHCAFATHRNNIRQHLSYAITSNLQRTLSINHFRLERLLCVCVFVEKSNASSLSLALFFFGLLFLLRVLGYFAD